VRQISPLTEAWNILSHSTEHERQFILGVDGKKHHEETFVQPPFHSFYLLRYF
jgi:hypothetical protein